MAFRVPPILKLLSPNDQAAATTIFPSLTTPDSIFYIGNAPDDLLFWLVLLVLGKNDPKSVERILTTVYGGVFDSVKAYSHAAAANPLAALGAGYVNVLMLARLGLLNANQAIRAETAMNLAAGFDVAEQFASIIQGFMPWKFGSTNKPSDFPQQITIVEGGKTETFKVSPAFTLEKKPAK